MGNLNDYKLVKQKSIIYSNKLGISPKATETEKARYGFYLLVLECVTGEMDVNDLTNMIIDTEFCNDIFKESNDDLGIDAYNIDEEAHKIQLFNFKYRESFNETNSTKESDMYDSVRFFSMIQNENTVPIKKSIRTKKAIESIIEKLNSTDIYDIELYMVANVNNKFGISPGINAFKECYDLKVKHIVLDDIAAYISDVPKNKNATLIVDKEASLTYENSSYSTTKSFLIRISLAELVRITCDDETIRSNCNCTDYSNLNKVKLEMSLLYENVRGYLGGTEYNKKIVETIDDDPSNFFVYNNGLTIVTNKLESELINGNKKIKISIDGFQVVNGGQTLRSIYEFCHCKFDQEKLANAEVLIRILKADNEGLRNHIAEYTNSQNAISDSDLKSVSTLQRQIEAYLKAKNITYLRKIGDYKTFDNSELMISMTKTAQIIYSYMGYPHIVGNQKKKLFKEYYDDIFNDELALDLVEKIIRLYFRITKLYEDLQQYKVYDQKVFYILYMIKKIEIEEVSDEDINNLINLLENTLKNYEPNNDLSDARKILKTNFKNEIDKALENK